ncbi:MAG: hypothetical protein A2V86_04355 [Deltaproteobacteria bacterium RBG_16_49_23]|nr:MAG: hypothetical protein A2V86_04355 [Deltaproteobacteria bacterium RBG_16_49_23]
MRLTAMKRLQSITGVLLFFFALAIAPCFESDCCAETLCVDCFCVQCLMNFNNLIEPSQPVFHLPQNSAQNLFVHQASLNLLEPAFEIDQPPKILA